VLPDLDLALANSYDDSNGGCLTTPSNGHTPACVGSLARSGSFRGCLSRSVAPAPREAERHQRKRRIAEPLGEPMGAGDRSH